MSPVRIVDPRYPTYRATGYQLRMLLGLKPHGHLPPGGMEPRTVQGIWVKITPQAPSTRPGRKSSTHRIFALCDCKRWVPAGRLHQHTCKP